MLRRVLIAMLVLLIALVVAADRFGAHIAAHVLAGKLESEERLPSRPSLSIGGFPFLTQVVAGKYSDVRVTAHDFTTTDGVPVQTITAHLHGVHLPFSKIVSGSVKRIPVDRVEGSAFVSFAGVAHYLAGQGLSVTLSRASPNSVDVIRRMSSGAQTGLVEGTATISVSGDVVTLSVGQIRVSGLSTHPVPVAPYVLRLPLRGLPFRFHVTSVRVTAGGIAGAGRGRHVTLGG